MILKKTAFAAGNSKSFLAGTIIILNTLERSVCTDISPLPPNATSEGAQSRILKQKINNGSPEENDRGTGFSSKKIWRFEVDVPQVLRSIKKYTGVNVAGLANNLFGKTNSNQEKNVGRSGPMISAADIFNQKLQFEIIPPNMNDVVQGVMTLIARFSRSFDKIKNARRFDKIIYGYVEEEPGVVKTVLPQYPPRYQEGRLLHLLELQKRRDKLKA